MLGSLFYLEAGGKLRQPQNVSSQGTAKGSLVARAQEGKEEAFAALFNMHKRQIYSIFVRMTGDRAEAERILEEVFLSLFRRISEVRGDADFSTELYRLVLKAIQLRLPEKRTLIEFGGVNE